MMPLEIEENKAEQQLALGIPINPALASRFEFSLLEGVSYMLSKRLKDYFRQRTVESCKELYNELQNVRGIGKKTAERLVPQLCVSE